MAGEMLDIAPPTPRGRWTRQDISIAVVSEPSGQTLHVGFFRGCVSSKFHTALLIPSLSFTCSSRQLMESGGGGGAREINPWKRELGDKWPPEPAPEILDSR